MIGDPDGPKPPVAVIENVTVFVWLAASMTGEKFVVTKVYVVPAGIVNVSRRDQLEPALRTVLCDATMRRKLAEERDRFVGEYLYFDGRATERIVQLVVQMLYFPRP